MKSLTICYKVLSIILFLTVMILISGCAISRATINTYVDPTFDGSEITKVAVFPVKNARFAPSEARQINRKISMAINQRNKNIKIMGSAESIKTLNDKKLADTWATFLDNYITSGVPDTKILKTIGDALKVDAIIQGEIVKVFQQDGVSGFWSAGTKGMTRVTVRFSMLGVKNGKVLWESTSDGIKGTAIAGEPAPPIIEAIHLAINKILQSLPF